MMDGCFENSLTIWNWGMLCLALIVYLIGLAIADHDFIYRRTHSLYPPYVGNFTS